MGRCYEFGAIVREGCGHAMVVTEEGGACACPVCGVGCEGLFKGCASVVDRPGYVPVSAPAWARPGHAADAEPVDTLPVRRRRSQVVDPAAAAEVVVAGAHDAAPVAAAPAVPAAPATTVPATSPSADRTAVAVEALQQQLQERDVELAAAFGRLSDAYAALTDELAFEREARVRLVNAVHDLSARIDAASRPLFGLKPRR